jgi:hypothetical protein
MASPIRSAAITVVGVALVVTLFAVLNDGDEPESPSLATIVVRDGQPVDGVQELEFTRGERISFAVESDAADEVHLHGYDVSQDVEAGGRVEFDVPATIEGVFEVELELSAVQLAEISVTPG